MLFCDSYWLYSLYSLSCILSCITIQLLSDNCSINPLTWASECPDVKNTNDGLTRSGTGCFIAVPIWQQWASKCKSLFATMGSTKIKKHIWFGTRDCLNAVSWSLLLLFTVTLHCLHHALPTDGHRFTHIPCNLIHHHWHQRNLTTRYIIYDCVYRPP